MMLYFIRLLLAHFISDIMLNHFALLKRRGSLTYRFSILGMHTAIVVVTTLLFFADKMNRTVLFCCLFIGATHFLIDILRLLIEKWHYGDPSHNPIYTKKENVVRLVKFIKNRGQSWSETEHRFWFLMNSLDQGLHLFILALVAVYLNHVLP